MNYYLKEKLKDLVIGIFVVTIVLSIVTEYKPKLAEKMFYSVYNLIVPNNVNIEKVYLDSNGKVRLKRNKLLYTGNININLSKYTNGRLGNFTFKTKNGLPENFIVIYYNNNEQKYAELLNPSNPFTRVYSENGNVLLDFYDSGHIITYYDSEEVLSKNGIIYYKNGNKMIEEDGHYYYGTYINNYKKLYYDNGVLFAEITKNNISLYYKNGNILVKKDLSNNENIYYNSQGKRIRVISQRKKAIELEEKLLKELDFNTSIEYYNNRMNEYNYISKVKSLVERLLANYDENNN